MPDFFVIAEDEVVLAFKLAGAEGRGVSGREDALDAFRYATGSGADGLGRPYPGIGAKVLVLTEGVAGLLEEEAMEWQMGGEYPLVVEIPGPDGRTEGRKSLVDAIREAVGIRV
ncbi:MAG TPA: V-type ATP synthase subunit F [Spirochaetales bacterium]|nr:V-type ATP synthase subunit F [Spirochaetales bacterium]HRY54747.1 V-type ATP synthase subunit F [Spirochaetia bacterium]HRZ65925.1 V-type ATP synthase subunit F [Spirochaetia bacterium]